MNFTEIELFKEDMKFSAGHFTIFSETERENIHGHNFTVYAKLKLLIGDSGISADYKPIKVLIREICSSLNEKFIVPKLSKHLRISTKVPYTILHFNNEEIPFMERDILILEIRNSTIEEFSRYIANLIVSDKELCRDLGLISLEIKVASGPGQWASYLVENIQ